MQYKRKKIKLLEILQFMVLLEYRANKLICILTLNSIFFTFDREEKKNRRLVTYISISFEWNLICLLIYELKGINDRCKDIHWIFFSSLFIDRCDSLKNMKMLGSNYCRHLWSIIESDAFNKKKQFLDDNYTHTQRKSQCYSSL